MTAKQIIKNASIINNLENTHGSFYNWIVKRYDMGSDPQYTEYLLIKMGMDPETAQTLTVETTNEYIATFNN